MTTSFQRLLLTTCVATGFLATAPMTLADPPPGASAGEPREDCLLRSQMRGWKSTRDLNSITIMISPGREYRVGFNGECRSLRFAGLTARLESVGGACVSRGDRMIFDDNPVGEICVIESIEKLPPAPDKPS